MRISLSNAATRVRTFFWKWVCANTIFSSEMLIEGENASSRSDRRPILGVVLSQHLISRAESFPPIPRLQLRKILSARSRAEGFHDERFVIGGVVGGRRWVTFYRLDNHVEASLGRAFFIVPEPLLIGRSMHHDELAVIERDRFRAFVSPMCAVHRAGGLINSVQQYVLAAGLPEGTLPRVLVDEDARGLAMNSLGSLSWFDWVSTFNPIYRVQAVAAARPAAIWASMFMLLYMTAASAYLVALDAWRSRQIAESQAQVAPLLESQRKVDRLHSLNAGLVALYEGRFETWRIWEVARVIWSQGGQLRGWSFAGSEVVLRGVAPSATSVLAAVSALKTIEAAGFDAPVRNAGATEEFVIKFSMTPLAGQDVRK